MLTRVVFKKTGGEKTFVIVDAGMNDLIRPCLYEAFHFIWPAEVDKKFVPAARNMDLQISGTEVVDVVGPICEGADFFGTVGAIEKRLECKPVTGEITYVDGGYNIVGMAPLD